MADINEINARVIDAVKQRYDGDLVIDADTKLEDLNFDSLDVFDAVNEIEYEFQIKVNIDGGSVGDIKTVGDLANVICASANQVE